MKKMKKVLAALAITAGTLSLSLPATAQTPSGQVAHGEIVVGGHDRFCLTLERGKEDAKQLAVDILPCTGTMGHPGERQGWAVARFIGLAVFHPLSRPGWCLGSVLPGNGAIAYDCSEDEGSHPVIVMEIHEDEGMWVITHPDGKSLTVNTSILVKHHTAPAFWGKGDLWILPDNWQDA